MDKHDRELRFVNLVHRVRWMGVSLAALPVAAVLYRLHAPPWQWALLLADGLLWPHLAWLHARHAGQPIQREKLNQLVDAAMVGLWVALMRFNLLPAVLLTAMMAMDHIGAGGPRWVLRSLPLLITVCGLVAWANGFAWQPASDMLEVLACLPMLAIYPVWLSMLTFRLSRRIRQQNRQLEELSRTDSLTGLANRAWLLDAAQRELDRYRRSKRPATLLLLDVDHFKQVNDHHGHNAGDAVLCALAAVLRGQLRSVDVIGRFGGDEFGVVMPETALAQARQTAERLRQQFAALDFDALRLAQPCTLSIGLAELGPAQAELRDWIEQADVALYQAKAAGRDRVCGEAPRDALA